MWNGSKKWDGTRAKTRFRLSVKRTSPFKSAGALVQSTTGSRVVHISGSTRNAGYTMFRGSVKSTGYPLPSPVTPSLPLSCATMCHHVSTWVCTAVNGDVGVAWPHNSSVIIVINVEYDHLKVQSVRVGQEWTFCSDRVIWSGVLWNKHNFPDNRLIAKQFYHHQFAM